MAPSATVCNTYNYVLFLADSVKPGLSSGFCCLMKKAFKNDAFEFAAAESIHVLSPGWLPTTNHLYCVQHSVVKVTAFVANITMSCITLCG